VAVPPPPPGVYILPNHYAFVEDVFNWYLYIMGEVVNGTSHTIRSIKISVVVYDDQGRIIETGSAWIFGLDKLGPGDKTCFEIQLVEPDNWAYYEFEIPAYQTASEELPNLLIINDNGLYDPVSGDYTLLGQVRNEHGTTVEAVRVVGTLYNITGSVLGCQWHYVNSTDLAPDQTSAFKLEYDDRDFADAVSYRLQADGRPH
jgi:hypothetical protein